MGYGDELMAAGQAQAVYTANPSQRVAICERNGEVRWHAVWRHNPIIATPKEVAAGEPVQRIRNGIGCRPYIKSLTVEDGLSCTDWKAREHRPVLHLSAEEVAVGKAAVRRVRNRKPLIVIEPTLKPDCNQNKQWPVDRYTAVVKALSEFRFLQMMHEGAKAISGVVTLWTGSFRDACAVLAHADGYLGPEGGLHHACAALGIPAVVIFGGFISPDVTGYPEHINIADEEDGSPCGQWKRCEHCREAQARITVERVIDAVRQMVAARECVA